MNKYSHNQIMGKVKSNRHRKNFEYFLKKITQKHKVQYYSIKFIKS